MTLRNKLGRAAGIAATAATIGGLGLTGVASASTAQPATVTSVSADAATMVDINQCPTLAIGYPQGGCVIELQTELGMRPIDGIFDTRTKAAVIAFQQAHGIRADGMVGPATKAALRAANSVATPQPGAPLPGTPADCLSRGQVSQNGRCVSDGAVPLGKSTADCVNEETVKKAHELTAEGLSPAAAELLAKEAVKKALAGLTVVSVLKCELLDKAVG
jgi:hypothetical protein